MAILNNKRWMYPITANGKASMLDVMTEPSLRIAGDMTIIEFMADPEVVRANTPEPLAVDGSGQLFLFNFEGWNYSDLMATEFVSEKRLQYAESYVMVPCRLDDETFYYMLFSWVNRDWLAYVGRHVGMPHKVADVVFSHFHHMDGPYGSTRPGSRLTITVENLGLVLRASVTFEREIPPAELPVPADRTPTHLGRRMFWDVCEGRPLVDDLVAHWGDERATGPIWGGAATLEFFDAENEEVLMLKPRSVGHGFRFPVRFNHSASPPKVVHRFTGAEAPERDGVSRSA